MSTTIDPKSEAELPSHDPAWQAAGKPPAIPSQALLRAGFWRPSAPATLRKGKLPAHEAWQVYWNQRPVRSALDILNGSESSSKPLSWAPAGSAPGPAVERLVELTLAVSEPAKAAKFFKNKRNRQLQAALSDWLVAAGSAGGDYDLALGALAAAHLLGAVGAALAAELGWKLIDALVDLAQHAQQWNPQAAPDEVLAQQMLAGELPLTLSYLFEEMKPLHSLRRAARERLSEGLLGLTNGEGLLHGPYRQVTRPLLACWTRCAALAADGSQQALAPKAARQYQRLVRQSLRWTAPNGEPLIDGAGQPWTAPFLQTALQLGGKPKDAAAARLLLGKKLCGKQLQTSPKLPDPAYQCDWSQLAVLRSGWSAEDATVAVDYSGQQVQFEAWSENRSLLRGDWSAQSRIDRSVATPVGNWEETCWFSDDDVDYLELAQPLEHGLKLERQILLAHRDGFLLLIDHLQAPKSAPLEHEWQLPLGPAVLFCGEGETRDALLVDGKPLARVMPLALPEWRIDPRIGELSSARGAIRLSQKATGRSMACPLFIDLRSRRSKEASTWRQLTVAESLAIQPADVAVSYRMQAGAEQWIYYRSQGPRGNRTFIGQNVSSECYVARFKTPSGGVEELLEIEG